MSERDAPPLRQLSEEVGRIARALAELSASDDDGSTPWGAGRTASPRELPKSPKALPEISTIRAMIRTRRLRERYFSGELFADPAWDMLLDLLLARLEERTVAVSSLCIAAAVPPTTALRWIKRLTDEGIFVRTADPRDGRRVFIDLSNEAAHGMASYIRAAERIGGNLP